MIQFTDASIAHETEKAILLEVGYSHACGHAAMKVWFPRSTVTIEAGRILVADWIVAKKEREMAAEYRGFHSFHADQSAS